MNLSPQDFKALLDELKKMRKCFEAIFTLMHAESIEDNVSDALEYAIKIIENYELDCKDLEGYLKDNDPKGFCQGKIYKEAISDIKRKAGIK